MTFAEQIAAPALPGMRDARTAAILAHQWRAEGSRAWGVEEALHANRCDCPAYNWTHQRSVGDCRRERL